MASSYSRKSRRKPQEEFHPNDVTKSPTSPTSYDIIAQACTSTSSNLKTYAKIRRLTNKCQVYSNIVEYIKNSADGCIITVQNIYKVERHDERDPFDEKYRIMLWHGTKPSSIPPIIQTGFRLGTGGWFGGGVYFADRIAMSYGYASYGKSATGTSFFILAEVCPGRVYKSHHIHSNYTQAPNGFDSVKGMGSAVPTWKDNKHYFGAILPVGLTQTNPRHQQYDLPYNEYIMYDPDRIIIRFVVECTL